MIDAKRNVLVMANGDLRHDARRLDVEPFSGLRPCGAVRSPREIETCRRDVGHGPTDREREHSLDREAHTKRVPAEAAHESLLEERGNAHATTCGGRPLQVVKAISEARREACSGTSPACR